MTRIVEQVVTASAGQPAAFSLHLPDAPGSWPLVVFCHGFKGFRSWGFHLPLADALASAGFAALRLDFSHNGVGQGADAERFSRPDLFEADRMSYRLLDLAEALRAALALHPRLDPARLGIFGHSLGGAVALLSLKSLPFRAVATLASVDRVGFPPEEEAVLERDGRLLVRNARTGDLLPVGLAALRDLRAHRDEYDLDAAARMNRRPWLIAHGSADASVPVAAARRLHALAPPGTAELLVVEGADHVLGCRHPWQGPTPAFEAFRARLTAFLGQALGVMPGTGSGS